ncbi:protein ANTAGONIST OF LIKE HETEROCHROMATIN PROTEIN 1 [Nilaparvata lugens]|uniref:protein ANTAGONIST OF LIKE HETEROCHROMATIN PROTEIN 1 n=1 Tax=Nilaparvata lugens TaxID=108931 RepID=UPI000B97E2F5|nr:protein ANTAGONIST OF LIKE HETEROCHROMATIN PROTEIN 1 [Nilaparvata lugens]
MTESRLKLCLLDLSSDSDSDNAAEEEMFLLLLTEKKLKAPNNFYLSKRKSHGQFKMTSELPDSLFTNFFRMNRNQFEEVHALIQECIQREGCNAQEPIGTKEKLAVFLRYIASGDSYKSIAYNFRLGDRTVSNIVKEVAVAIWEQMQPIYLPEPSTQKWESVANRFEQRWQFPHCVGAVDGKHVVIKKPNKSGSSYFNYKHTFSVVLLATVDADYKFITVDVGAMGRFSDGSLFSSSALGKKLMKGNLLLPEPKLIPSIDNPVPYVLVGDEAFPLSVNLMRPYPRRNVTGNYQHQIFNARLSRARQPVECAFGILASRFRIFRRPFESKVDTVTDVVKATCVIHNYLRESVIVSNEDFEDIERLPQNQLLALRGCRIRRASNAFTIREQFTKYFNNFGAVPWQHRSVMLGNY